jgi:hypothetical protein
MGSFHQEVDPKAILSNIPVKGPRSKSYSDHQIEFSTVSVKNAYAIFRRLY